MASPPLPKTPFRILYLIFSNMDTLDFAAPFEVLTIPNRICTTPSNPGPFFIPTIVAATTEITTSQGAILKPDMLIPEAMTRIKEYDILVVPGGRREVVVGHGTSGEEFELVSAFTNLVKREDGRERVIFSVCTGAFILAGTGVLDSMKATTHHQALDALQAFVDERGGRTEVLWKRFVDAGVTERGMRVVTSGGISSGLDGSLYLLEVKLGIEAARQVEVVLEHRWRKEEGLVV